MDNRLIFLYRRRGDTTDGVTQEGRHRPRLEGRVQATRGEGQGNPAVRVRPDLKW